MKLFISWSGARSRAVATALRRWIPDVIQSVEPWMSDTDIDAGARWNRKIEEKLGDTQFGIICLTKTNHIAPWLLFEAGALAKSIVDAFVCPYLIDLEPSNIPAGPLTQFQAKRATEKETWELVGTINKALKDESLAEEKLRRTFERWWPDLKNTLENLPEELKPDAKRRSSDDMVAEILELTRGLSRQRAREDRRNLPHSSVSPILSVLLERVVMRDGYKCKECGSTDDIQLQHVVPLAAGGAHSVDNLHLVCPNHRRKGTGKLVQPELVQPE